MASVNSEESNKAISPLTFSSNVKKVDYVETSEIVRKYLSDFNLDVSSYFKGRDILDIYECQQTDLRFYYPFGLTGDAQFYDFLNTNKKTYYTKQKWEFTEATRFVNTQDAVLEIGCGSGYFLENISSITQNSIGLELSPKAIEKGLEKGLTILGQPIQEHAEQNIEKYDYVCAFQLFEHLDNIADIIASSVKTLKKGGKLVIGVPNNSSLVFKLNKYHTLNLPPHHVLLWDEKSLTALTKVFNLKLLSLSTEPANKAMKSEIYKLRLEKIFGAGKITKLIHATTRWFVKSLPSSRPNQTILAIYEKL